MLDKTIVQHTRTKQNCLRQPFIHSFNIPRVLPRTTTLNPLNKRTKMRDCSQNCCFIMEATKLYTLSEEVLVLILEYLDARTLIRLSKTSRLFHRLCHSDVIWRHRCKIDFNLRAKWLEYSYLYLYELFTKASVLKNDPSFFRPVSQLKTSVIVWYLINPEPPSGSVCQLTASQAKSIWNLTDDDLDRINNETEDNLFSHNYYEWESLYKLFLAKHGGINQMQNYVLRRCLRNRQALEEHYQLSLHSSRQQKWYQFLDNRDTGNKFLKALTEHMPKVTHSYMLHQVTAMYIDGHLKGGFETVKAYADFCGYFKTWLEDKSVKLWPPRQGEMLIKDYKDCLQYVNKEISSVAEELQITLNDFLSKAKPYIERLHEIWLWQNKKGQEYMKEHRPSRVVTEHKCYKRFLDRGNFADFCQLKQFFERREIVVDWFKKNEWLHALLRDYCTRSLRPAHMSTEISPAPHLPTDPITFLVNRFLQTGLKSDFNKLRMKLSEIGNLQLESLNRKSRQLQRAISRDLRNEDSIYFSEVDAPQFTHCFYPQRTDCRFSQRQPFASIEVVNLD
ncbi:oocyte-specific F-box [Paramuricea clavata]|uniref:Oocyte-specific F-box n=3 Tax=Paramuricea clavata TaxID=317549 RepID=A0A7D9DHD8_PARCT|nr:oocyte-specific F-box [Paramuricea clavata]